MLSVIVPARNNPVLTRGCISAAVQSLDLLQLRGQFILIDDASDPGDGLPALFQELRANAPQHEFVVCRTKKNFHYTGVFSVGLHLSRMEKIFFLSNDMLITPYFFAAVLEVAALDPRFGVVRGTSNYADSHPEHTVVPPNSALRYEDIANFSRQRFETEGIGFAEVELLSGDAVLISRSLVNDIGVLDLRFFGYFGDLDYGMRAHLAGYKIVCAKGAWLWHEGAGHVKAAARAANLDLSVMSKRRMQLVQAAYAEFRGKWDETLSEKYDGETLGYFALAEKNAGRVQLKYELPRAALQDIEFL